jgi:hypothetical protein
MRHGVCAIRSRVACARAGGTYAGPNAACNAQANLTTPCCLADFNQVGGQSVQDVFAYLVVSFGPAC